MKFLLDANIPYSAKEIFPARHTVWHVRDLGLFHSADEEIAARAREEQAVIVTRDLDFANTLNFPPELYYGIIVMRIPYFYSARDIKRVLQAFIIGVRDEDLSHVLTIVQEGRSRTKT